MRRNRLVFIFILCLLALLLSTGVLGEELPLEVDLTVPEGRTAAYLQDEDTSTRVTLRRGEEVEAVFSSGDLIYLEIFDCPQVLKAALLNEKGEAYETLTIENPAHMEVIEVQGAKGIRLWSPEESFSLSTLQVYAEGFESPLSKEETVDMLVLLPRAGEEWRLGGLLPQYAGENGLTVGVVYAAEADGFDSFCALSALADSGVKTYPVFLGLRDTDTGNYKQALTVLGGEKVLQKKLVTLLREMRPKVVVLPGNDGDTDGAYTAALSNVMEAAVSAAADSAKYPGTEAHAVQRVYRLCDTGETVVSWQTPLVMFEGRTAAEAARAAYENYTEKLVFGHKVAEETAFTLIYGEAEAGQSLLGGMDTAGFAHYAEPTFTPVPTFTPAPTDTPASTEAPAPVPTATAAVEVQEEGDEPVSIWTVLGLALLIVGAICIAIALKNKKKWAVLPLAGGMLCAALLIFMGRGTLVQETAEAMAVPTFTPTPVPTAEPTAEATIEPIEPTSAPTPEPTAEPDPWAELFLEGDEAFFSDFDGGHWQYRSENLYIDILRVNTELEGKGPLVYYAADIYMRSYSSYRSGVRSYTAPWKFARAEKAVLAITGDNLVGEEKELKGCLIRKGKFYADYGKADTMVIGDNLDLQVYYAGEADGQALLDRGVRDSYSFGPVLIRDGVINENAGKHRVASSNPRCGVGMVEPGHWVAITTDGRQGGYSVSIDLPTFAQLFADRGCTAAYNLDGGSSTAMVFMGDILNIHAGHGTSDVMRPWTDALMWGYSQEVPTVKEWTQHDGYRH